VVYLAFACRCLIGLLFAVSVGSKVCGSAAFTQFTATTRTLVAATLPGHHWRTAAQRWLPRAIVVAETAVVVLVAAPAAVRFGFGLAAVLLAGFTWAIAAAMRRRVRTSCQCFGASTTPLGAPHLIRNGVLLLVALTGLTVGPGELARTDRAGLVLTFGAAAIAVVVIARLDDLIALSTPRIGLKPMADDDRVD
jgi:hypothetical protein